MSFFSSLRASNFFQQIGRPQNVPSSAQGHLQGIVYDIEYRGKFNIYKVFDKDGKEVVLPAGAIVARILGVHDGLPANQLPIFLPFQTNHEMPLVGSKVWIISNSQSQWFWESLVDRTFFSQNELDVIEDKFGNRVDLIKSSDSYKQDDKLSIENNVDPTDRVNVDYLSELQNGIDVERRSGAPLQSSIPELRKLPGELGIESRYGGGLLFSYGEFNNSIIYFYNNRVEDRISLSKQQPVIVIGNEVQINDLFQKISNVDNSVYPSDEAKRNFVVVNAEYIGLNSDSNLLVGSLNNIILSSENVVQKANENLDIFGKNIRIQAENAIELTVNNSKIMVNFEGIKIYTDQEIQIESINNQTIKSNKNIKLQADSSIRIDAINIIIGNFLKVKNRTVIFGQSITKLIKSTFIQLFNSHIHISPTGPTGIPIPTITEVQERAITTQKVESE